MYEELVDVIQPVLLFVVSAIFLPLLAVGACIGLREVAQVAREEKGPA